jgi:hypothetical protein
MIEMLVLIRIKMVWANIAIFASFTVHVIPHNRWFQLAGSYFDRQGIRPSIDPSARIIV